MRRPGWQDAPRRARTRAGSPRALFSPGQLALVGLAVATCVPACHACNNDHPFVPYRIDAGASGTSAPGSAARAPVVDASTVDAPLEAGAFPRSPALIAPPHATSWTLGKLALAAPPGATFRQGLTWDIDGDGRDDALVLVEEADERLREDLYFYRGVADGAPAPVRVSLAGGASGATMAEAPLVLDVRCARIERLARVGKRSAAVEVGESCPKDLAELGPDRVVALVAWTDSLRTRFALPVVDAPGEPAQALALDFDGTDVDGDGLDDATLRVSLEGGEPPFEPRPEVHAVFRWFDRPAGMSREPGEPERSLHAIAASAQQRATRPKEAASAVLLASAGRFLFQAICAESPVRRVAPASSPLACEAGHALEELGLATTRAEVSLGDALRAIAALDAAELPPATHTPARAAETTAWITTLAPVVQASEVRAIGAVPRLGPLAASWGALRFEPSGQLLVRTLAGVVRVDPVHGDEVEAGGVLAWGTTVASPDGKQRLEGAFAPCRGIADEASLVAAQGEAVDGGDATSVPLPVAAPLAPRCAAGARDPVPLLPIAWGSAGLEVVVAGEPVLIASGKASPLLQLLGQPVTPGAPRSPDGATVVVPTSLGLAVRGQKTRLLRAKELEHGYAELRDCTVSDDAARVACVRGGVAFVGVWPLP